MRDLPTVDSFARQMIGTSPALRQVEQEIQFAARRDVPVLVTGERGVGKQLVARRIHEISGKRAAAYTTIRCPFSDICRVLQNTPSGGTAVLIEAEHMTRQDQAALTRWFETGHAPAVRLITSSCSRLYESVKARRFSDVLFYRLNMIHIHVPPLRERFEDVPVLLEHFLRAETNGVPVPELSAATLAMLTQYEWPENVHEVRRLAADLVDRGVSTVVYPEHLPPELIAATFQ